MNEEFFEAIRRANMAPPTRIARLAAMINIAIFDAVNLLVNRPNPPRYQPYTGNLPNPADFPNAQAHLSAEFAGRRVLQIGFMRELEQIAAYYTPENDPLGLYGVDLQFNPEEFFAAQQRKANLDRAAEQDNKQLSETDQAVMNNSQRFGEAVANAVLAERGDDGSTEADAPPAIEFGFSPGDWRETGSGRPVTPAWGRVASFARWQGGSIERFLPTVLIPDQLPRGCNLDGDDYARLLSNPRYTFDFEEVRELGRAVSNERTDEQTRIAFFWANDVEKTYKPPGQLLQITGIVARNERTTNNLLETARLFALVGIALADASIIGWYVKFLFPEANDRQDIFRLWRPETAIRMATSDCRPETRPEAAWEPLSINPMGRRFSPTFPAFISGHAIFGAAHAAVMRLFYGRDDIAFTALTDDPNAIRLGSRQRRFASFTEAAIENAISRIYLGVHYRIDASGGYESGIRVGTYVFNNVLRPQSA